MIYFCPPWFSIAIKLESTFDGVSLKFDLRLGGATPKGERGVGETEWRTPIEDILDKLRSLKGEQLLRFCLLETIAGTARFVSHSSNELAWELRLRVSHLDASLCNTSLPKASQADIMNSTKVLSSPLNVVVWYHLQRNL